VISNKRSLIVLGFLIAICFSVILFLIGYAGFRDPKIGMFKVLDVVEFGNKQYITYDKAKNAVEYQIDIIDRYENILHTDITTDNKSILPNLDLGYEEAVTIKITAFNKRGTTKDARNLYIYEHTYASFSEDNNHYVVDSENKILLLDGKIEDNYRLEVVYRDQIVHKADTPYARVVIPYEVIEDYTGKLVAKLYHNDLLVNTYNLYHNATIVSDVEIISPNDISNAVWNDLSIKYTGGINATSYSVKVYIDKKLIAQVFGNNMETIIPASIFNENTNYTFEVVAMYEDYIDIAKRASVNVFITEKVVVDPVYVNYNPSTIKMGSEITLTSRTSDTNIYYTLDGTNPLVYGVLYSGPITIGGNVTIKAAATKTNCLSSSVNTYNFTIREKDIVIYLSPSNQYLNFGVKSVGFTNEQVMMNKVADVIEKKLKSVGVIVYRNTNLRDGMTSWLQKSRSVNSDLHFAIHSNGSTTGDVRGMEIFVHEPTSEGLSIATKLYNNLYEIYPYNNEISTNRGVKFARGSLGEVHPANIKTGVLMEIAFHDNINDAKWIAEKIEEIGNNLAESIIEFYQIGE